MSDTSLPSEPVEPKGKIDETQVADESVRNSNEVNKGREEVPPKLHVQREDIIDYKEEFLIARAKREARAETDSRISDFQKWMRVPGVLILAALSFIGLSIPGSVTYYMKAQIETSIEKKDAAYQADLKEKQQVLETLKSDYDYLIKNSSRQREMDKLKANGIISDLEKRMKQKLDQFIREGNEIRVTSKALTELVIELKRINQSELDSIRKQNTQARDDLAFFRTRKEEVKKALSDLDKATVNVNEVVEKLINSRAIGDLEKKIDKKLAEKLFSALEKETKNFQSALCPIGSVVAYSGPKDQIPVGWNVCDGSKIEWDKFTKLRDVIGTTYGGQTELFYRLPDYRGYFLRGSVFPRRDEVSAEERQKIFDRDPESNSRLNKEGIPGPRIGSYQPDSVGPHRHSVEVGLPNGGASTTGPDVRSYFSQSARGPTKTTESSGKETRPKNIYVHWIIKVK